LWKSVEAGDFRSFSIGGAAQKVDRVLKSGKAAKEIVAAEVTHISLVRKGANNEQFLAKTGNVDAAVVGELRALLSEMRALRDEQRELSDQLAALPNGSRKSSDVRKAAIAKAEAAIIAKRDLDAKRLAAKLSVLNNRLMANWEYPPPDAAQREKEILAEIARTETGLETLRPITKGDGVFDRPDASAFHHRGGTSRVLDAGRLFPGNDSAFVRPTNVRKKSDDDDDLNFLII
jgi:hypothetical protein